MNTAVMTASTGDKYDQEAQKIGNQDRICPASQMALRIDQDIIVPCFQAGGNALNLPTYRLGSELRDGIFSETLISQTASKIATKLDHAQHEIIPHLHSKHPDAHVVLLSTHGFDTNPYKREEVCTDTETVLGYHQSYCKALSDAGYDGEHVVHYETIPSLHEAKSIVQAMGEYGWGYTISFTLDPKGNLIDGTPLHEAIGELETFCETNCLSKSDGYLANCFAPEVCTHLEDAQIPRWIGAYPNTLNNPDGLDTVEGAQYREPDLNNGHIDQILSTNSSKVATIGHNVSNIVGACCGNDIQLIRETTTFLNQEQKEERKVALSH